MSSLKSSESIEGVAIIGMACRFPGARSVDEFWSNLRDGVESITYFSDEELRRAGAAASTLSAPHYVKAGFILEGVENFDASFFGLSPGEAEVTDPQQRLFLECAWEALESAGCDPEKDGQAIGVFAGASLSHYLLFNICPGRGFAGAVDDLPTLIGSDKDYLATRVSYKLNLRGPSVGVQTACSTSLVAVHMACQSLLNGECDVALAGGVTIRLPQEKGYTYQEGGYLSPDGHCRAFDAEARGAVFGNGVGVVVLKRLADAVADGDSIDAVIRGSAINNDGSLKVGYTAPSVEGQARVVAEALAVARVEPETITYLEAHGTGTPLGDPIEVAALSHAFRAGTRAKGFCALGSVKTNVGHLESAAGVAGLVKTTLALKYKLLPPSLNFTRPNPGIDFENSPFYVVTELSDWKTPGRIPRRAGVSSFGIGGTNAHVVLEEFQSPGGNLPAEDCASDVAHLLPLSARSPEALRALAGAYHDFFSREESGGETRLRHVCYTASVRRAHHGHRAAFVAHSRKELCARLKAFAEETAQRAAPERDEGNRECKVIFVFPGQGAQWWAMGRELLKQEIVFRSALEKCDEALRRHTSWSLMDELAKDESESKLDGDNIEITQVTLFAVQVAVAALWRSWGVTPSAVVGHSMGELAAAHVAGALSLDEAMRVMFERSRLLRRATQQGGMAAVELTLSEAVEAIAGYEDRLAIAASNGPRSTVLSGSSAALESVLEELQRRDIFYRRLRTTGVAGHSPQVDGLRRELVAALEGLRPREAVIPMVSTVTGAAIKGEDLTPRYWSLNLRKPVLFAAAISSLMEQGYKTFLEISPHPVLSGSIEDCLRQAGREGSVLASLRRHEGERAVMLSSLGSLYTSGYRIDWSRLYPNKERCVKLPAYPWQRKRFWIDGHEKKNGQAPGRSTAYQRERWGRPLPGRHLESAVNPETHFWETRLDADELSYLKDHRVQSTAIFPAAAYLECALGAAAEAFGAQSRNLKNVKFQKALPLSDSTPSLLQTVISPGEPGHSTFEIYSREGLDGRRPQWVLRAAGEIIHEQTGAPKLSPEHPTLEEVRNRCQTVVDGPEHYRAMHERGMEYGAGFQGIELLWRTDGEALARLQPPKMVEADAGLYEIHPCLLDACFQTLAAVLPVTTTGNESPATYLPVEVGHLRRYGRHGRALWGHAVLHTDSESNADVLKGDLFLLNEQGEVLAAAWDVCLRRLDSAANNFREYGLREMLYEVRWETKTLPALEISPAQSLREARGSWLIFADGSGVGRRLEELLAAQGGECVMVVPGDEYKALGPRLYQIRPSNPEDFRQLFGDAFGTAAINLRGVAHLWGLDAPSPKEINLASLEVGQKTGCISVLHLIQALAERATQPDSPHLLLVTRGVQAVGEHPECRSIAQSPLWGLGRVIAYEHRELRCKRIDLGNEHSPEEAQALLREILQDDREDEVALRGNARYVSRLTRHVPAAASLASSESASVTLHPNRTYLITGALGGLGLRVAGWMIEHGARHLVLTGRSLPSAAAAQALKAMGDGARIMVTRADVSRPEQVADMLAEIGQSWPPLQGIIHAAGVLDDGLLVGLEAERFRKVLTPKLAGAWVLHTLTQDMPLDFFILFSSAASLLGSPGQGNHSAANAFLDALAHFRRGRGLPGLSINWGPWSEVGLAAQPGRAERLSLRGLGSVTPQQGLAALGFLLRRTDLAQVGVMPFDLAQWSEFYPNALESLFFSRLTSEKKMSSVGGRPGGMRGELLAVSTAQRRSVLEAHLRREISEVLRLAADQIDADQPLSTLGLDSLRSLEVRNRLEISLQLKLPVTLIWKYPTVKSLAASLAQLMSIPLDHRAESPPLQQKASAGRALDMATLQQLSEEEAQILLNQKLTAISEREGT